MTESENFCKGLLVVMVIVTILIAINNIPNDDIDQTRIDCLQEDIKYLQERGDVGNQDRINDSREKIKLTKSRAGLLTQTPDYSENPTLSKRGSVYVLEDGSFYHDISYRSSLYIGKIGSMEYVLGDNLTKPITNGYQNIYVPWWGLGTVYGELGNQAGPIGHI